MNPFRTGDRVRLISTTYQPTLLTPGALGTVEEVLGDPKVLVCWDDGSRFEIFLDLDQIDLVHRPDHTGSTR